MGRLGVWMAGRGNRLAGLLCLAWMLQAAPLLPSLEYGFDEGVYVQQARRIWAGERPFVDFFAHQPPLYVFTLAPLSGLGGTSPVPCRLLSLVATAATAFAVYRLALAAVPVGGALAAALLFLTAPLQYFGLLAIPNALAGMFATVGVALVWRSQRRSRLAAGAVCLVLAPLYKPVMASTALALGAALLVSRAQRWKVPWVVASGALAGGVAFAALQGLSQGRFGEVVAAQLGRTLGATGFEIFGGFGPHAEEAARRGVDSSLAWSLSVHARTFLSGTLRHANVVLAVLAAAGQILVLSPSGRRFAGQRVLLTAWWAVPLAFCLGLWDPIWNHYLLQYLPPLAVLGGLFLGSLPGLVRSPRMGQAMVAACVAAVVAIGILAPRDRLLDYSRLARPDAAGERWLTFDPFLNLVTGTEPACGLVDPFNVYGPNAIDAHLTDTPSPHHVDAEALIACLERDPGIRIALGYWALWFVDDRLRAYLETQPPERFVRLGLRDL